MHVVSMSLVALLYIFLGVVVPLKKLSTNIKQNNKNRNTRNTKGKRR